MRILLVGEYSRLHNSLKEGLITLGHEVTIVGNGDSFKDYPVDYNIEAKVSHNKIVNIPRQILYRLFQYDCAKTERGIRFNKILPQLKNYDVVQLINEAPIKTTPKFEKHLLKKLLNQNGKCFLLSCGVDLNNVNFLLSQKVKYSLLTPYFENPSLKKHYSYIFDYLKPEHQKISDFVIENCQGIIASDIDYVLPLQGKPKFLGLIPNPINTDKISYTELVIEDKVKIFLGINTFNRIQKGITYFEEALKIIRDKYGDKVEISITENLPYNQYIKIYNDCHILLDNIYGYDQGYNALEAMAKGKVVFTGAEQEFVDHYELSERVCVNATPNVNELVENLSYLIDNTNEIKAISKRAKQFVEEQHHYIHVAKKYLEIWTKN